MKNCFALSAKVKHKHKVKHKPIPNTFNSRYLLNRDKNISLGKGLGKERSQQTTYNSQKPENNPNKVSLNNTYEESTDAEHH